MDSLLNSTWISPPGSRQFLKGRRTGWFFPLWKRNHPQRELNFLMKRNHCRSWRRRFPAPDPFLPPGSGRGRHGTLGGILRPYARFSRIPIWYWPCLSLTLFSALLAPSSHPCWTHETVRCLVCQTSPVVRSLLSIHCATVQSPRESWVQLVLLLGPRPICYSFIVMLLWLYKIAHLSLSRHDFKLYLLLVLTGGLS